MSSVSVCVVGRWIIFPGIRSLINLSPPPLLSPSFFFPPSPSFSFSLALLIYFIFYPLCPLSLFTFPLIPHLIIFSLSPPSPPTPAPFRDIYFETSAYIKNTCLLQPRKGLFPRSSFRLPHYMLLELMIHTHTFSRNEGVKCLKKDR